MKKVIPVLLLAALVGGCSGVQPLLDLIASPTPQVPTETFTPQPTVTLIPTYDLFATLTATPVTFTPTETPFVPDRTSTHTPAPTETALPPSTFQASTFFTPKNNGFLSILISGPVIYWNTGACMPRNIKFTVFVEDIEKTDKVFLMVRAREKADTLLLEKWSSPAEMIKSDGGSFTYNLTTDNIKRYFYHIDAWLEYQLVATDKHLEVIARTQIFDRSISLVMCRF